MARHMYRKRFGLAGRHLVGGGRMGARCGCRARVPDRRLAPRRVLDGLGTGSVTRENC
ncbi:hypothetical protein SXCC_02397 [Gluconacetobacter sp. SXCC-1]|nr:hypothetical protein SXCC_02397 [Gluconacetobacter sp. SXCC-1]